jgi:DNA-directed RNA polymerase subunit M/transcription elongation factor TFIIS
MVPKNTGSKTVLICRSCGHTSEKFSAEKYKITENIRHRHGDILVVEESRKRPSEEERKYIVDLYGNEMYEMEE